jgi:FlaA1/EpsC-like NDP-sugar epimerase
MRRTSMFDNKVVLITGGTESFGKKFIETILARYPKVKKIIIFSRDELKQFELKQRYPPNQFPQLRFFIGDVIDASCIKSVRPGYGLAPKHIDALLGQTMTQSVTFGTAVDWAHVRSE